jgi:hypothetical protein
LRQPRPMPAALAARRIDERLAMLKSWPVCGSLLALAFACGVSCTGIVAGTGRGAAGNAGRAGSAENGGSGGSGGSAGDAGNTASAGHAGSAGSAGSGGAEPADCSQLSVAACANTEDCTVLKARLVSSPPTSADEAVGCQSADTGCSEVNITARDPQGQEWAFPTTCIPAGWVGEGGAGNQ